MLTPLYDCPPAIAALGKHRKKKCRSDRHFPESSTRLHVNIWRVGGCSRRKGVHVHGRAHASVVDCVKLSGLHFSVDGQAVFHVRNCCQSIHETCNKQMQLYNKHEYWTGLVLLFFFFSQGDWHSVSKRGEVKHLQWFVWRQKKSTALASDRSVVFKWGFEHDGSSIFLAKLLPSQGYVPQVSASLQPK